MATTLDHISGGRAILGIGGAWFEEEHEAFGLDFGSGFPERLRWLGEALPVMRGMLDGTRADRAAAPHYHAAATRNLPSPVQAHLPICIGGGGEQVTLKLVARYADMNNVGGGIDVSAAQGGGPAPALRDGRTRPGRDRADDRASARWSSATTAPRRSGSSTRRSTGTASPVTGRPAGGHGRGRGREARAVPRRSATGTSSPGFPANYDEESMTRFATEVRPLLEKG